MAQAEVKEEKKIAVNPVVPNRRVLAEHGRQTHLVTVEGVEDPAAFEDPAFWSLVAKDMTIGDHIEVRDDALSFWAEYLVVACDRTWVKVAKLREVRLTPVKDTSISPDYEIAWKGPHRRWCVIRLSDRSAVHEGSQDRATATTWLNEYVRNIGAKLAA